MQLKLCFKGILKKKAEKFNNSGMYLNKSEKFKPKEMRRKEIKQKMRQATCNRKLKKKKKRKLVL